MPIIDAMTQSQFFAWAQAQDERYEFDGARPVAMTGGTVNHGLISGNLMFQLKARLRGTACVPSGSDGPGVNTTGSRIRYPEAVVTCTRFSSGRDRLVPNPVVIFEVVSDSSRRHDRIVKLDEYQAVPSIRRYVLIEQTAIGLTVYTRQPDQSWTEMALEDGHTLNLPEIGIEIPVTDLYEGVSFDEPD